jgi:type I restriction enzyme S subunit
MSEWREATLDEISIINPTENLAKDVKAKKVNMDVLIPFTKKISNYSVEEYRGGMKFRNGDTLIARITPCLENGKTAYVDFLDDGEIGFGSTEFIVLREKEGRSDSHFLYYFALSPEFRDVAILSMTGSSGRQRVQLDVIKNHPFLFPPLPEQRAIASVISSLDDKIDLLHRENKTLEAMAETLFRQWFIEEAKDEWEEVKLGDFFPVVTGRKNANFATSDGSYPFFTCSQSVLKAPSYSFNGAAILLAGNGDFNIKHYIGKFEAYQRTYVLMPYDTLYFGFLLTLMKYYLFDITKGYRGSVIDFITKPMIEDFVFLLPKRRDLIKDKLVCFNDLYRKVDVNMSQIRTLEKLRDTLLPKLMSGEVRVKYEEEEMASCRA